MKFKRFLWTYGLFGWFLYVARPRLWCAISGHEEYWWCSLSKGDCVAATCNFEHYRNCRRCGAFSTYDDLETFKVVRVNNAYQIKDGDST